MERKGVTHVKHSGREQICVYSCVKTWGEWEGFSSAFCTTVCLGMRSCVCVQPHVWLTFSLALYQWVIEANRRWRLRRQTNYQQVIGSTPVRPVHVSRGVRVCVSFCGTGCWSSWSDILWFLPLTNIIMSAQKWKPFHFLWLSCCFIRCCSDWCAGFTEFISVSLCPLNINNFSPSVRTSLLQTRHPSVHLFIHLSILPVSQQTIINLLFLRFYLYRNMLDV